MSYILLISDMAPCKSYSAGIVLEQFFSHFSESCEIGVYNLIDDGLPNYELSPMVNGQYRWTRKPIEYLKGFGYFRGNIDKAASKDALIIVQDIIRQISRRKPDQIIISIQGQTSIRIALELHRFDLNFSTIHWDPFSWWRYHNGVHQDMEILMVKLRKILPKTGVHLIPSKPYADYLELPINKSIVINLAVPKFYSKEIEKSGKVIRLCFAGQTYASNEIDFFLQGMNQNGWKLHGKNVELHTFGPNPLAIKSEGTVHHGWTSPESLVEKLSHFDAAILPYPSQDFFKETSMYSFPSKFATYVSADLPVIFIGNSVNPFSEELRGTVFFVENGDIEALKEAIGKIQERSEIDSMNRHKLYNEHFSSMSQRLVATEWMSRVGLDSNQGGALMKSSESRLARSDSQFNYKRSSDILIFLLKFLRISKYRKKNYDLLRASFDAAKKIKIYCVAFIAIVFYYLAKVFQMQRRNR